MNDSIIETTVSNFIETQFPEFYLNDGPTFILFLKKYYEWLEGQAEVAYPFNRGTVAFSAKNALITGTNTFFTEDFEAGDRIALYYDETEENYEIFTIDNVVSNTVLYLTEDELPTYSSIKSLVGWIEIVKNPNYHIRRFYEYDDIDATAEEFIVYFKEKYLKNIQFTTQTNKRQLIKHSLDLYRSKGTPRALDLLFKLVFGTGAKTYYPAQDIFKLSDGNWYIPKYLEISLLESNVLFVNKQIYGITSGATAFVEELIRKNVDGKFIDVAYISSVRGDFLTGEYINTSDNLLPNEKCPYITGALTTVSLPETGTSENYVVGDEVELYSSAGVDAKGLVANTIDTSGTVEFELLEGGYAYTANAEVAVSDKVLIVNAFAVSANNRHSYVDLFETVIQPMANITYVVADGTFLENANLNHYYANGDISGNSIILSVNATNSTAGTLLVAPKTGNLNTGFIGTTGNVITANISAYANASGVGNVIGTSDKAVFKVSSINVFEVGEEIYQSNTITGQQFGNATITRIATDVGSNSFITVANCKGTIVSGIPIRGRTSNDVANVINVQLYLGVIVANDFSSASGNYLEGNSGFTGNVTLISSGAGATYTISNTLLYSETIDLNTDYLADIASVELNAATYGFPGNTAANLATQMILALSFEEYTIGKIYRFASQNKGLNYNLPPVTRVVEPVTFPIYKKDVVLQVTGASGLFAEGEVVTQEDNDSRGLVKYQSGSNVFVELLRFYSNNYFTLTTNATTVLVGELSGVTANVSSVLIDETSEYIGLNALIGANTANSTGAVTDIRVISSGFNFIDNEPIYFTSLDKPENIIGQGTANLGDGIGISKGFYKQKGGFLSDDKKLFDGLYYQDFSYEVRSSVTLNKYENMLKEILHIPGTKYFGAFVHESFNETNITSKSTVITSS